MAVDPWIGFGLLVGGFLLVGALVTYGYWWFTRPAAGMDPGDAADAWRREALALVREVRALVEESRPAEHDRVDRKLLPLSFRLQGHARGAPAGVDEELAAAIYELGAACHAIGMDHTAETATRTGVYLEDLLASLDDDAAALERALADEE